MQNKFIKGMSFVAVSVVLTGCSTLAESWPSQFADISSVRQELKTYSSTEISTYCERKAIGIMRDTDINCLRELKAKKVEIEKDRLKELEFDAELSKASLEPVEVDVVQQKQRYRERNAQARQEAMSKILARELSKEVRGSFIGAYIKLRAIGGGENYYDTAVLRASGITEGIYELDDGLVISTCIDNLCYARSRWFPSYIAIKRQPIMRPGVVISGGNMDVVGLDRIGNVVARWWEPDLAK